MDSLFETSYQNSQPIRKFEPLIRFDIDGKPQPRKPYVAKTIEQHIDKVIKFQTKPVSENDRQTKSSPKSEKACTESKTEIMKSSSDTLQNGDLKRKVPDPPHGVEPSKKKQQKSIMHYFGKK